MGILNRNKLMMTSTENCGPKGCGLHFDIYCVDCFSQVLSYLIFCNTTGKGYNPTPAHY